MTVPLWSIPLAFWLVGIALIGVTAWQHARRELLTVQGVLVVVLWPVGLAAGLICDALNYEKTKCN